MTGTISSTLSKAETPPQKQLGLLPSIFVFYFASLNKTNFHIFSSVSDQLIDLTKLSSIFYFYIFLPFSVLCQVFRVSSAGKSVAGRFLWYMAQSNQISSFTLEAARTAHLLKAHVPYGEHHKFKASHAKSYTGMS